MWLAWFYVGPDCSRPRRRWGLERVRGRVWSGPSENQSGVWPVGCVILALCCCTHHGFCCWYVPVEVCILFLTSCPAQPDTQRHLVDARWRRKPAVKQETIINIAGHLRLQNINLRNVSRSFCPSYSAVQVALKRRAPDISIVLPARRSTGFYFFQQVWQCYKNTYGNCQLEIDKANQPP